MSRKLTHTLGDALQHARLPDDLPGLIMVAKSRGIELPRHRVQKPNQNRHKKNEANKGLNKPRTEEKESKMAQKQTTTQQNTTPAAEDKSNVLPTSSQGELDSLAQFGEQLGALLGHRPVDRIQWKAAAQECGTFAVKAGIVTTCGLVVMGVAKHMSKGATTSSDID